MNIKKLLIVLLVAIVVSIGVFFVSTKTALEIKGYELFGAEYCQPNSKWSVQEKEIISISPAFHKGECQICGKTIVILASDDSKLCARCAIATNRCSHCGKKNNSISFEGERFLSIIMFDISGWHDEAHY